MTQVATLLWRSELRVQGLWGKRRAVWLLESVVGLGVLAILVIRVRDAVVADAVSSTNLAVIGTGGALLLVANVLVLGEESRTRVPDLTAWTRSLPFTRSQVRSLLMASGMLKGALFSGTLVGSVAIGALVAHSDPVAWLLILFSAVVLPLLPVAIGLRWGARRKGPLSQAFMLMPFGLVLFGLMTPLPEATGPAGAVVRAIAVPGLALLGMTPRTLTVLLLACWAAAAIWLLRSTSGVVLVERAALRPPRADVLADVSRRGTQRAVLRDLHSHRLGARDAGEVALLGVAFAVAACLVVVYSSRSALALTVTVLVLLALPAVLAGYSHTRAAARLSGTAEAWLAAQPLPQQRSRRTAHALALAGGATCAGFPAVVGAVVLVMTRGPSPAAWVVALLVLATPLALGGWVGAGDAARGGHRVLMLMAVTQLATLRAVTVGVLVALAPPSGAVLLTLVAVDATIAGGGHLVLRRALRGWS